jgi:ABC-type proline/glycine betaine transport system ATPase subunit
MVMDAGQVGEYGSPKDLLKNPKSLFSQLIAAEQQQEKEGGFGKKESSTSAIPDDVRSEEWKKEEEVDIVHDADSGDVESLETADTSALLEYPESSNKKQSVKR